MLGGKLITTPDEATKEGIFSISDSSDLINVCSWNKSYIYLVNCTPYHFRVRVIYPLHAQWLQNVNDKSAGLLPKYQL